MRAGHFANRPAHICCHQHRLVIAPDGVVNVWCLSRIEMIKKCSHPDARSNPHLKRGVHLFYLAGLNGHAMYARQRINKMQARRQRFVAHLAEKIDDPDMSGRDHAS